MKSKKLVIFILFVSYILTLLPFGSLITRSKAASISSGDIVYYNTQTTSAYNKYGIKGIVYEDDVAQYDDLMAITTTYAFYTIKDGTAKSFDYKDRTYTYKYGGRYGNDVFLLAKKVDEEFYEKKLLWINLESGVSTWESFEAPLKDKDLMGMTMDSNGDKWFLVQYQYKFMFVKYDKLGSLISQAYTSYTKALGDEITDIYCDVNNNLWFTSYTEGNDVKYHTDSISTLSLVQNGTVIKKLNSFGRIKDFNILSNGEIWYIPEYYGERTSFRNYVAHLDKDGNLIKGYNVTGADSLDIDSLGRVWFLDGKGVKLLENEKFVDKFETPEYMSKLLVDNAGNMVIYGENEIILRYGSRIEAFRVDAYVRDYAYVTKDNQGIVKIISRDNYKYHDLMSTTINKDWTLMSKRVSILNMAAPKNNDELPPDAQTINNKYAASYKTAEAYYDDLFVYAGDNELYKINGAKSKLYSTLDGKLFGIETKEIDGKLQLYAVCKEIKENDNGIIIIYLTSIGGGEEQSSDTEGSQDDGDSQDPVTPIPVPESEEKEKVYYNLVKLIMDKNGDLYLDVAEAKTGKKSLFKKIDDIDKPFTDPIYLEHMEEYESIFLNENGEIEYVFKGLDEECEVWARKSKKNNELEQDEKFAYEDTELTRQFGMIKSVVKAYDDSYFMLLGDKIYTKEDEDADFIENKDIKKANSLIADRNGCVYIGTDGQGVISFVPSYLRSHNDSINPGITYMNIARDSKSVPVDSAVDIFFNENLKEGENFNGVSLKDRFGNIVPGKIILNGSMISIKPDRLMDRSSIYTVTIPKNAVKDMADKPFEMDYVFKFTTVGEKVPPSIVKAEVDKVTQKINITFSEEIEAGSNFGKITFTDVNGKGVIFNTSIKGKVLTISITDKLIEKMKYRVTLPAECVMDLEGNKLEKGFDLYFKYE